MVLFCSQIGFGTMGVEFFSCLFVQHGWFLGMMLKGCCLNFLSLMLFLNVFLMIYIMWNICFNEFDHAYISLFLLD